MPKSPARISLKPEKHTDRKFLRDLYSTTRAEELSLVPWADEEKETFLDQQFNAQHRFYQDTFSNARFDIIVEEKENIGRLYVDDRKSEIRIIDIAIMPSRRRQGIGQALLQDILDRGRSEKKVVSIHVEKNNPAMSLYKRLGFVETEDQGVYLLMKCHPDKESANPDDSE